MVLTADGNSRKIGQDLIIIGIPNLDLHFHLAGIHMYTLYLSGTDILIIRQSLMVDVFHPAAVSHEIPDQFQNRPLHPVIIPEGLHPLGQIKAYGGQGEFQQNLLHDIQDILLPELITVDRQHGGLILPAQIGSQSLGSLGVGALGIKKDDKRSADLCKLLHRPLFRLHVGISWQLTERPVCRHHNTNG